MNAHVEPEAISAYLDGEVGEAERARIEGHLAGCDRCGELRASLQGAALAVAALPQPVPTPDEARAIRLAVLGEGTSAALPARRAWPPRIWALAGGVALLGAGIVGYAFLRSAPREAGVTGAARPQMEAGPPMDFASDEQLRDAVAARSEVKEALARYRVADVGEQQGEQIRRLAGSSASAEAPAQAPAARSITGAGAEECIRAVLRTQPYPMMPLVAEPATYRESEVWLLVFAWTTSSQEDARLDRVQVWLVTRTDCTPVNFQTFFI